MVEIKGSVILDSITGIKKRDGAQAYEELVALLDEDTKRMFQGVISGSSWYSLELFLRFLAAEVNKSANGNEEVLVTRSEKVIERQLRGIYKVFVKLGSPEFLMKRIAAVHMTYFNGVAIEFTSLGPGKATIRYTGFEAKHRLIGLTIVGFFRKALDLSGATERDVRFTTRIEEAKGYADLAVSWK
ncbi:MAG TPA: hypothetical protein VKF79_12610 [Candidatus Acidoferrum sp.]|nr:hypothetical protein [Candidatus Acidoferrum sp.]